MIAAAALAVERRPARHPAWPARRLRPARRARRLGRAVDGWSVAPDRSWDAFNRSLVYCAFAVLGLRRLACPRPARTSRPALAAAARPRPRLGAPRQGIPSLFPDGARVARLRNPVGYWNSLALVAATAVPLGLWAATRGGTRP